MPPINAVLSPDGNTITLYSPENCDRAFVTISGNGTYLTEMVNFTDQTATLDVSDLDCGVYLITVEYETVRFTQDRSNLQNRSDQFE